ncbi:MAG: hypothetical protein R6U95_04615 [Bacteroidales bacterium]
MSIYNKLSIIVLSCFFISSCVSDDKNTSSNSEFKDSVELKKDSVLAEPLEKIGLPEKLDYLITNMTISDNMIQTLSSDPSIFNYDLLNSHEHIQYYTTSRSKAINLGVYGADLNYLIHFEQSENSIKYLIASRQLAGQIGVAMAFDQETIEQYESSIEDKDALISIIFMAYDNVKKMLKSEDQFLLSTLVITGSWVENMYLTTQLLPYFESSKIKTSLVQKIIQQKEYLNKMISLISELQEGDNIYINNLLKDLREIDAIYQSFEEDLLTEQDIETLGNKITQLRTRLIKVE